MTQMDSSRLSGVDERNMTVMHASPAPKNKIHPFNRRLNQTVDHKRNRAMDVDSDLNDRTTMFTRDDLAHMTKDDVIEKSPVESQTLQT